MEFSFFNPMGRALLPALWKVYAVLNILKQRPFVQLGKQLKNQG